MKESSLWNISFGSNIIWDKVLKNGLSKICGRQPLKILLGPFLNTLSHLVMKLNQLIDIVMSKIFRKSFA